MKKDMVLGFIFSKDLKKVILIKKQKPDWQKNLLNGVGGHIKDEEKPFEAIKRKTLEEAGLDIDNWNLIATMNGEGWYLYIYTAFLPINQKIETKTDEEVSEYNIDEIGILNTLLNTKFLVYMCLDFLTNKNSFNFVKFLY